MISIKEIYSLWNRFWFSPQNPEPIALFRILFGFVLFAYFFLQWPERYSWYGQEGILSLETAMGISSHSRFSIFDFLPNTHATIDGTFILGFTAGLCFIFGAFTRLSAGLVFLILVSLQHRNTLIVHGGDAFTKIALFLTIFSNAGNHWSIDSWRRKKRGIPIDESAPWATRLLQLYISLAYFFAVVFKLQGESWLDGTATFYSSRLEEFWRFPVPYIFEHAWSIRAATYFTLLAEFSMACLVWIKELRLFALMMGVLLHLGMWYSMNIPLFSTALLTFYVLFLDSEECQRIVRVISGFLRFSGKGL